MNSTDADVKRAEAEARQIASRIQAARDQSEIADVRAQRALENAELRAELIHRDEAAELQRQYETLAEGIEEATMARIAAGGDGEAAVRDALAGLDRLGADFRRHMAMGRRDAWLRAVAELKVIERDAAGSR